MVQEKRITVKNINFKVDDNAVAKSTVAKSTALGPRDATVFENTVLENCSKYLSLFSLQKSTDIMENDTEVLFSCFITEHRSTAFHSTAAKDF